MQTIFALVVAANVALTLASLAFLPDQVACHFGPGGTADSWVSKEANAIIFLAIEIPLFLMLRYAPLLTRKFPPQLINLPNKDYCLQEANWPVLKQKLDRVMSEFGIALYLFLLWVTLLTLHANLSDPVRLSESAFIPALVVFLGYTVIWTVGLWGRFKIPKEEEPHAAEG